MTKIENNENPQNMDDYENPLFTCNSILQSREDITDILSFRLSIKDKPSAIKKLWKHWNRIFGLMDRLSDEENEQIFWDCIPRVVRHFERMERDLFRKGIELRECRPTVIKIDGRIAKFFKRWQSIAPEEIEGMQMHFARFGLILE